MTNPILYRFGFVVTLLSCGAGYYDVSHGGSWLSFATFGLFALVGLIGMSCGESKR